MRRLLFLPALLVCCGLLLTGCADDSKPPATSGSDSGHDHDHDHDHHHHHELGPNGGHLLELGESGYQAEWIHEDEAGKITVIVLDADKQPARVAYGVDFETSVGEVNNAYTLTADDADNDGLASTFTITDGELLTAVKMAEQSADAARAVIVANLQNGKVKQAIEVHDHDHDHAH